MQPPLSGQEEPAVGIHVLHAGDLGQRERTAHVIPWVRGRRHGRGVDIRFEDVQRPLGSPVRVGSDASVTLPLPLPPIAAQSPPWEPSPSVYARAYRTARN